MAENTISENGTITVGFLRLCGSDVKCLCCGQIYRSAMEKLTPQGICGRCFQAAFPLPLEIE